MKGAGKLLVLFLLIAPSLNAQTPALTVPEFNFSKFDKASFTNKNLASGKMLFFMFFDCDCDHCQHAMANLNKDYDQYKKTAIYLVSLDDQKKINAFMQKYAPGVVNQKNVTMLQDTKNEFITRFKPRKYPSMFLYSADKKLLDYEDNPDSMFRFPKRINSGGK